MSRTNEAFILVPGYVVATCREELIAGVTTSLSTSYNNLKGMMTSHVDTLNSLVTTTTIPQVQSVADDLRARLGVMVAVLAEFFTLLGQVGAVPFQKIVTFVWGARGMDQEDAELAVGQQLGTSQQWEREMLEVFSEDDDPEDYMAEMHDVVTSPVAEQTGFITT